MSITVYPPASSSSLTPLSGSVEYTFSTQATGSSITIDFTDPVPAGTYSISGITEGGFPVRQIKAKNSAGATVGTGTTTFSVGSFGTSNNGSFAINSFTATDSFTKMEFAGLDGISAVRFSSSTTVIHVKILPGSREVTQKSLLDILAEDPGTQTYDLSNVPLPSGPLNTSYIVRDWFYNGKLYIWWASQLAGTAPDSSITVNMGIKAYDFATQTWGNNIVTFNPSTGWGYNTWSRIAYGYGPSYVAAYIFKNGNVMFRIPYWLLTNASTTVNNGDRGMFFNLNAGTVTAVNGTFANAADAVQGSMYAYNPANDEYYVSGRQISSTYGQRITKLTNTGGVTTVFNTNSQGSNYGALWCTNSTTPKISFWSANQNNTGQDWYSYDNGTLTGSYNSSSAVSSTTLSPITNMDRFYAGYVETTLFGQTYGIRVRFDNQVQGYLHQYTYPTAGVNNPNAFTEVGTMKLIWGDTLSDQRPFIQAISPTGYGIVQRANNQSIGISTPMKVIPLPNSATL